MNKLEKNINETNDTMVESTCRTYIMEGYPTENGETQPELKEYYIYPNVVIHDYEKNSNSLLNFDCPKTPFSCQPKNSKVFIRRVDNKNTWFNKTYNVLNGSYYKDLSPPIISSRNSFDRKKMEEHNYYMDANERGETNEKYISNKMNDNTYMCSVDESNYPLKGQVLNDSNIQIDVPLCVQEATHSEKGYNVTLPMNPINQNGFYYNYITPEASDNECSINTAAVANFVHIFFRYIYKVFKLAFEKIKRDFNTKEVYFDSGMLPFHDLDISCEVCRTKYGDILMDAHNKDCLAYFEGYDETRTMFTKLWDIVNNWIDSRENSKIEIIRGKQNKNNEEAYYQLEEFPKDENGKIELPKFKTVDRQKSVKF
ncbi:inner membrane complex protein, putative [Plasmodium relictum]|uniref:Inner membrane complex protein, putative n=1 Tax=Plasmodium relictum TaxID=85471 RepID=A0A1J1H9N7_PLARL|nr:inner membrane complex protein, putative [Plasmodium relictum]CRH01636.1 inner membrane complex protein, putative [Plasmodium relictum]